jgi:hypothetical protein
MNVMWSEGGTGLLVFENGNMRFIESGLEFEELKPKAEPWQITSPNLSEVLDAERASMSCTPAQMRLTLHRAGLLATVQAIADSDPEASIVWEYATVIQRNSPFIDALAGDQFTPEQIDDLFRVASNV